MALPSLGLLDFTLCGSLSRGQWHTERTPRNLAKLDHLSCQQAENSQLMGSSLESQACPQGCSRAGSLPPTPELNHGLAATLSTHRRDLAIPRAINRGRLLSWAPRRAGGLRESKANSQGGEGLSLPKERSGNSWGAGRERCPLPTYRSPPSQEGTMHKEQPCPQGDCATSAPCSAPWGLLLFGKGTGKGFPWHEMVRGGCCSSSLDWSSPCGCEAGAVRPLQGPGLGAGQEGRAGGQSRGCSQERLEVEGKIQIEGVL